MEMDFARLAGYETDPSRDQTKTSECAAFQIDREAWAEKTETAFRNLVQDADFIVPCTQ